MKNVNVKVDSPDVDLGIFLDAYLTCDGFTYNITRMFGPPPPGDNVRKLVFCKTPECKIFHNISNMLAFNKKN